MPRPRRPRVVFAAHLGALRGQRPVRHEVSVLLGVVAVDEADRVVEALLVERVLVPEYLLMPLPEIGVAPEGRRAGGGHPPAVLGLVDEHERRELVYGVLLPARDRKLPRVNERVSE